MLSYQHDYHAGNHADVLKHAVLAVLVEALQRKKTPIRVLDSHAGAGCYDLDGEMAQHGREYETGIARLLEAPSPPSCAQPYLGVVRAHNVDGRLRFYPGSPQLALALLREQDRLELFELHPQAAAALRARFGANPRVHVHVRDGFEGIAAVVPPKERRGIALVDPSYEQRHDFERAAATLAACLARWPNGVTAIWYPLLARRGAGRLLDAVRRLRAPRTLRVELVAAPAAPGLRGSGLVIANLPYRVEDELDALLPWLARTLAPVGGAWTTQWLNQQAGTGRRAGLP